MNFLYRTSQPAAPELPRISEQDDAGQPTHAVTVRLAGWCWPVHSRGHMNSILQAEQYFSLVTNQPEQYFDFFFRPAEQPHSDSLQKPTMTLEGLIADDPHQPSSARSEDGDANNGSGNISRDPSSLDSKSPVLPWTHTDVAEDEGWITIPYS